MSFRRLAFVGVGLCLFVCAASWLPLRAQRGKRATFAVSTQLVEVPVIVFDEKGALATNLAKEDFHLVDDGVVQQIQQLDSVRTPVSFVMVADLSSSMARKIPFVQQAALSLLDPQNDQDAFYDEFAIVGIGNRARELVSFTRDHDELKRRLPLLLTASNEATALFDGIYFSVTKERREAANQRRAIIIISDGGDNHSLYNLRETKDLLEESEVPVFAVMAGPTFELPAIFPRPKKQDKRPGVMPAPGFPNLPMVPEEDFIGPAERQGPHNLSTLTEVTGGGTFTAKNEEDLARIVRTIGQAVRYQYVLSYQPMRDPEPESKKPKQTAENQRHKIHLELYPKEKFDKYSIPYYRRVYNSLQ